MDLRNRIWKTLILLSILLVHYCQAQKCTVNPLKQDKTGHKYCNYKSNESASPLEVQLGAELFTTSCQTCRCSSAGLECCEGPPVPSHIPAGCKAILKKCKYLLVMKNDTNQKCVPESLIKPIRKDQLELRKASGNQNTVVLLTLLQQAVDLFKSKPGTTSTTDKPPISQAVGNSLMFNQRMGTGFMGNSFVPQQTKMGYMGYMPMQQGYNFNPMYYQGYGMGYMGNNYMQPQQFGSGFMSNPYFSQYNAFQPKRPQSTIDYADIEFDPATMMRMMNRGSNQINPFASAGGGVSGMLSGMGSGSSTSNPLLLQGMEPGALGENPLMMQLMRSAMAARAKENSINNRLASLSNTELQTLVDLLNPTVKVPKETPVTTTSKKQISVMGGNGNSTSDTQVLDAVTGSDATATLLDFVPLTTTSPNFQQNLLDVPGKGGKSSNSLAFMDYTLADPKASANSIWI